MAEPSRSDKGATGAPRMIREVAVRQHRMQQAESKRKDFWASISMLGVVGWSIAIPSLAGALIGAWLEGHWNSGMPWSIGLLIVGLVAGCLNAWRQIGGGK